MEVNAKLYGVSILGYCLMTNHVHLVAVPKEADALAQVLGRTHGRYASYANTRLRRSGHFWQNRFFSCAVEEPWAAVRYVERNPVRAGLVETAEEWEWSSALAHVLGMADPLLEGERVGWLPGAEEWRKMLSAGTMSEVELQLRVNTYTGRPSGSADFVRKAELELRRPLAARQGGRPKKVRSSDRQRALACGS